MKIYTKTGDRGTTGLIGGQRVAKDDPRLDCYGTIDELNAFIGLAITASTSATRDLAGMLAMVQSELFVAGSHLATPENSPHRATLPPMTDAMIARLEAQIDDATALLSELRNFILPGGSQLAAHLHVARTVCRRAERLLVRIAQDQAVEATLLIYFNRLSDWLFVQARRANQLLGVDDVAWRGAATTPGGS